MSLSIIILPVVKVLAQKLSLARRVKGKRVILEVRGVCSSVFERLHLNALQFLISLTFLPLTNTFMLGRDRRIDRLTVTRDAIGMMQRTQDGRLHGTSSRLVVLRRTLGLVCFLANTEISFIGL